MGPYLGVDGVWGNPVLLCGGVCGSMVDSEAGLIKVHIYVHTQITCTTPKPAICAQMGEVLAPLYREYFIKTSISFLKSST